nr:hypothetical protein [Kibdelosporangium sp. MJ126-NF4]
MTFCVTGKSWRSREPRAGTTRFRGADVALAGMTSIDRRPLR